MTRFLFIIVCLTVSVAGAAPTGARRILSVEEQQDWLAVGRLNVQGQGYCTATLVAPDVVLTAAHCLVDRRTGKTVAADRVHFLPGFRAGTYVAHGRVAQIALLPGYSRKRQTVHLDLALVRLTEAIGVDVTPMALGSTLAPDAKLETFSYGIDRSQIPSVETGCHAEHHVGSVLYTDCEGVPGVSGAPVVQMTASGPHLVAVASAMIGAVARPVLRGKLLAVAVDPRSLAILSRELDLNTILAGLDHP